jgi:hypothetical protein
MILTVYDEGGRGIARRPRSFASWALQLGRIASVSGLTPRYFPGFFRPLDLAFFRFDFFRVDGRADFRAEDRADARAETRDEARAAFGFGREAASFAASSRSASSPSIRARYRPVWDSPTSATAQASPAQRLAPPHLRPQARGR